MSLYYNPDGELERENWNQKDEIWPRIAWMIFILVLLGLIILGILTVIRWIF